MADNAPPPRFAQSDVRWLPGRVPEVHDHHEQGAADGAAPAGPTDESREARTATRLTA